MGDIPHTSYRTLLNRKQLSSMGLASKLASAQAAYPGGPPTSLQPGGGAPGGYNPAQGGGQQQYQAYPGGPPSGAPPGQGQGQSPYPGGPQGGPSGGAPQQYGGQPSFGGAGAPQAAPVGNAGAYKQLLQATVNKDLVGMDNLLLSKVAIHHNNRVVMVHLHHLLDIRLA